MSATTIGLRETLRRALVGGFDRREVREKLATLEGPHAEAARVRAARVDSAKADREAWREPKLRLQRIEAEARSAAAAEARERDRLEFELRRHPASCVTALSNYRDAVYSRIHARKGDEFPIERMAALGPALVAATLFCRDDAWKLNDRDAQEECQRLRGAIDAALEGKPAVEDGA